MKSTIFTGNGVALITPFDRDLQINYNKLTELIEFQIENGTDCIVTCGTTGESATMTTEEHIEVMRFTVEKVNGRIPVIAGTGSNDTKFCTELSIKAKQLGVDALLLVTPYYNKTSQKGLVEHFNFIANEVKIPCVLYNVPARTGLNMLPESYLEASKNPYIVALKEANHDLSSVAKTISLCGDDLDVYSGEDNQVLPIMALGGKGVISVFANAFPKEMTALTNAMKDENLKEARSLSAKYFALMDGMGMDVNPIPLKAAMNLMGMNVGNGRMPLTTMTEENIEKMRALLKRYDRI